MLETQQSIVALAPSVHWDVHYVRHLIKELNEKGQRKPKLTLVSFVAVILVCSFIMCWQLCVQFLLCIFDEL
jgi:hypothetical protein